MVRRRKAAWVAACVALLAGCSSPGTAARPDEDDDTDEEEDGADASTARDAGSKVDSGRRDSGVSSDSGRGAADTGVPKTASQGLPCDVKRILGEHCGTCHGDPASGGAPMPLTTQAHFQAAGDSDASKKVHQLVKTRINASTDPMPPITELTAADLKTLNDWLDDAAPASEESCEDTGSNEPEVIDTTGLECYKFLAHAEGDRDAKFEVGAATDAYYNFGFQAPWQGMVYGIVVKPVIDNAAVLHHWLLYREDVEDGSIEETIGQHGGGELIHGWAPGGISMDFRKHGDVGFELPGTTYAVEFHYNSSDPNATDASGVELCVQRTPPKNIASMSWLGYDQGGTLSYATGLCLEPATSWTGTCEPAEQTEPIHLLFMTPHLHETGTYLKAVVNGPSGSRVLHDKPFNFAYQVTYETEEVLMPGESITTTCTFSEPKCAGQATSQEMCYLFTYAYPKHALVDNGPEGRFMHGEGVCLGQ